MKSRDEDLYSEETLSAEASSYDDSSSEEDNDLGIIDPSNMDDDSRQLFKFFIEGNDIKDGAVIPAGQCVFIHTSGDEYTFDLEHEVTYLGDLTPSHFEGKTKERTKLLLSQLNLKNGDYIIPGAYAMTNKSKDGTTQYSMANLTQGISARDKVSGTLYYDISVPLTAEEHLGEGAYGCVDPLIGTLKVRRYDGVKGLVFEPNTKRISKIQRHDDSEGSMYQTSNAVKEYKLLQKCPHFGVRGLFFCRINEDESEDAVQSTISLMTMHKMPGKELFDVLDDDERKDVKFRMTTGDRFDITIQLLRALRSFHAKELVHRDFKLENLIVNQNKETGRWEVKIIDLGVSRRSGAYDGSSANTAIYAAPEVHEGKADETSDIYAAGRVISAIWRDKYFSEDNNFHGDHTVKNAAFLQKRHADNWDVKFDLFDGIKLGIKQKEVVQDLLSGMTKKYKKDRPSLDSAIQAMETAYFNHKYCSPDVDQGEVTKLRFANNQALRSKQKIEDLLGSDRKAKLKEIIGSINAGISQVKDGNSVAEFVSVLGTKCLQGLRTKADVASTLEDLRARFNTSCLHSVCKIAQLESTYQLLTESGRSDKKLDDLGQYIAEQKTYMGRLMACQVDIDGIAKMKSHADRKISKLGRTMEYFSDLIVTANDLRKEGVEERR